MMHDVYCVRPRHGLQYLYLTSSDPGPGQLTWFHVRLADQALGAMADDLQRLLAGDSRAHHLLDIPGIAYFESVHAFAFPARPSLQRLRLSQPSGFQTILLKAWLTGTRAGLTNLSRAASGTRPKA